MDKNSRYHVIIIAAGEAKRLGKISRTLPKSFLTVHGGEIIDYHLDILSDRGFQKVSIVVGFLKELFYDSIGTNYKNLSIDYIVSEQYNSTSHEWSLYLTKDRWLKFKMWVILIHADVFYDPQILNLVTSCEYPNVISVDSSFAIKTGDECIVRGEDGVVTGLDFDGVNNNNEIAGELIGVNKFHPIL